MWFQRNRKVWGKKDIHKIEAIGKVKHDVKFRAMISGLNRISAEDINYFVGL